MSNEIMQENTPFVECSAFHRGMSVLEASLRNTEDVLSVPVPADYQGICPPEDGVQGLYSGAKDGH